LKDQAKIINKMCC